MQKDFDSSLLKLGFQPGIDQGIGKDMSRLLLENGFHFRIAEMPGHRQFFRLRRIGADISPAAQRIAPAEVERQFRQGRGKGYCPDLSIFLRIFRFAASTEDDCGKKKEERVEDRAFHVHFYFKFSLPPARMIALSSSVSFVFTGISTVEPSAFSRMATPSPAFTAPWRSAIRIASAGSILS